MQSLAPNVFGKGILKIITFVTAQCGGSSPFYPYISMVLPTRLIYINAAKQPFLTSYHGIGRYIHVQPLGAI
jgi:hypothetical protein